MSDVVVPKQDEISVFVNLDGNISITSDIDDLAVVAFPASYANAIIRAIKQAARKAAAIQREENVHGTDSHDQA